MTRAAAVCLALLLSSGPLAIQGAAQGVAPGSGAAATRQAAAAEYWIVSETTSPLDYAPVIVAAAWSSDRPDGPAMQLSIQCRRGRTDLVIVSPALTARPENHRVSYTIDDGPSVLLQTGLAASGAGIAVRDDVVRLLTGLPGHGEITFQAAMPQAAPLLGRYALGPLWTVLDRIAGPCKWPVAANSPPGSPTARPK
jgi:hypothetical protein